jgi:hypothetical protein
MVLDLIEACRGRWRETRRRADEQNWTTLYAEDYEVQVQEGVYIFTVCAPASIRAPKADVIGSVSHRGTIIIAQIQTWPFTGSASSAIILYHLDWSA